MNATKISRRSSLALLAGLSATRAAQAQRRGGTLTSAFIAGTNSLDPHFSATYQARGMIMAIYETLFTVDERGATIPMLAERYELSPDRTTYTVPLRRGVKFHNGQEMTGADVQASLERFGRLSPEHNIMAPVVKIDSPDPYTVVLRLAKPEPTFLDRLAAPISPASIIPATEATKDLNKTNAIGTGPFQLVNWQPSDHLILERFAEYTPNTSFAGPTGFGGRKTVYLDRVIMRIMPEAGARLSALESGQVQEAEDVPPAAAKRLRRAGKFQIQEILTFQKPVLYLNHQLPPTNDLRVRQAIALALDMSQIMPAAADNGPNQLDNSLLYPGNALFTEAGKRFYNQNNQEKAKALLKEAGYKGQPITFIVGTLDYMANMGLVITPQLQAAGLNVQPRTLDLPTLLSMSYTDTGWNMITFGQGSQPFLGAYAWERLLAGDFNVARVKSDPTMAALWAQFDAATDLAGRRTAFEQIQARTWEQVYLVLCGDIGLTDAIAPNVIGFKIWNGAARFWNVGYR